MEPVSLHLQECSYSFTAAAAAFLLCSQMKNGICALVVVIILVHGATAEREK